MDHSGSWPSTCHDYKPSLPLFSPSPLSPLPSYPLPPQLTSTRHPTPVALVSTGKVDIPTPTAISTYHSRFTTHSDSLSLYRITGFYRRTGQLEHNDQCSAQWFVVVTLAITRASCWQINTTFANSVCTFWWLWPYSGLIWPPLHPFWAEPEYIN